MLRFRSFGLWMLLWFTFASSWSVADFVGNVSAVHDGDTITVLTADKRSVKVRLFGIDAPELGAPYSFEAKRRLSDLVFWRQVRVETRGRDRYGRTLGIVFLRGEDINAKLVREGLALADVKYSTIYVPQQSRAMSEYRNIWSGLLVGSSPYLQDTRRIESAPTESYQEYTVYITRTGKRYHLAGCRYLRSSSIPVSLSRARASGYTPCKVCIGSW